MPQLTLSEFADRVGEIMPVMMKEFLKRQAVNFYKTKITMPQFFVLEFLDRGGESKMSGIAKFINVSTAAITGIVERLVRDGYVIRTSDPKDRRIVMIRLTSKGTRVVKDATERRKEVTMKMFGVISQEEREQYLKILSHIQEHLQE
jgi:DNA-binding MarR family transcriptional regulator